MDKARASRSVSKPVFELLINVPACQIEKITFNYGGTRKNCVRLLMLSKKKQTNLACAFSTDFEIGTMRPICYDSGLLFYFILLAEKIGSEDRHDIFSNVDLNNYS